MHGPFVEHARISGHSHSLHNHPGGPQDDAQVAQQLPCSAATFAATTFAVLTILAITHTLHTQMRAKCVPPSLAGCSTTYNEQPMSCTWACS